MAKMSLYRGWKKIQIILIHFNQLRISMLVKGGKTFIWIPIKDGAKSNDNGLWLGRWLTGSILLCAIRRHSYTSGTKTLSPNETPFFNARDILFKNLVLAKHWGRGASSFAGEWICIVKLAALGRLLHQFINIREQSGKINWSYIAWESTAWQYTVCMN